MKKMIMLSAVTGVLLLTGCGENTYDEDQFNEDAPVITLLGDRTIEIPLGQRTVNEPGFSATDTQDGDITYAVKVTNNIDLNTPGTYTVTYNVMDSEGFTDTETRTITILDPNSNSSSDNNSSSNDITPYDGGQTYTGSVPQIKFPGGNPLYLALGEEYDTAYSAQDFEDGDLGASVKISGSDFNINQTGTYTVTYSVTDSHGNTATERRTVFVGEYTTNNDTTTWSDTTWNDITPSDLDNFKSWYSSTCGNSFNDSLYNENTGYYAGTISCASRGLDSIDLSTMSIFSSIQSIDFSHNNLDYIDLSPFNNTNVIEKVDLSHNNFSSIDFTPLYQLNNINELWINNNNLNYNRAKREEIYRGFNNKSFTIYF